MKDTDSDDEGEALRQMIMETVKNCTDTDLLDVIYKLLIYDI